MGAFLDKPKTEKTTQCGEGYGIKFGVSAMQGWRMEMEDAHVCTTEFKLKNWSFFGVFDGHAGSKVSLYCAENLLACILQCLEKHYGVKDDYSVSEIEHAMHDGFIQMDSQLLEEPQWKNGDDHSGTTGIVVMISPTHIIWANCGDSRGLFCRSNELNFATSDHKPVNVTEKTRIEKAGGTVMMQRVNGTLAVSRALGDFAYKRDSNLQPIEQLVSPEPDLTSIDRESDNDEFLVLACDGIYDVMSNNDVLTHVRHKLELTDDLEQICSDLIDTCLHKNSRDNMSVILVTFPGAPKVSQEAIKKEEELQQEAKEKILERLNEIVAAAHDPLEVEENYVIQQLTLHMPNNYDVAGKRPMIGEKLQELTKIKFGSVDSDNDFTGPSDSSMAPPELRIFTRDSGSMLIKGVMSSDPEIEEFHSFDENLLLHQQDEMEDSTQETENITSFPPTKIDEEMELDDDMLMVSDDTKEEHSSSSAVAT